MEINSQIEVDDKALVHSFNPYMSRPEQFIKYIQKHNETNYRSTFWIDFNKFRPYRYFIVLFVEAGTKGKITAWGLCDRKNCIRVKDKQNSDPFLNVKYGFPGDKESEFKSVFHYKYIGLFEKPHSCSELTLIRNGLNINNLKILRSAIYVHLKLDIIQEIKKTIKSIKKN